MADTLLNSSDKLARHDVLKIFLIAFFAAVIFFLPAFNELVTIIFSHFPIERANFNYAVYGDGGVLYSSSLANLSYGLHHGFMLKGVDYLTHGGSSEFYVRSNYPVFFPLTLLLATVFKIYTFKKAVFFQFVTFFISMVIGFHFLMLLLRQKFQFSIVQSFFVLSIFGFSWTLPFVLKYTPFSLAYLLFPVVLYISISSISQSKLYIQIIQSFVYFSFLFIGYLPLSLMGILLSLIFAMCYVRWMSSCMDISRFEAVKRILITPVIAVIFAGFGCLAIVKFVGYAASPSLHGLKYSVLSVSQRMSDFISIFSPSVGSRSPEAYIIINLVVTFILLLFFIVLDKEKFKKNHLNYHLFLFSSALFVFVFLISFGYTFSLGSVFHYLVPALGRMHGYVRYYIFVMPFLGIAACVALKYIFAHSSQQTVKRYCFLLFSIIIVLAVFIRFNILPQHEQVDWSLMLGELIIVFFIFVVIFLLQESQAWLLVSLFLVIYGLPGSYFMQRAFIYDDSILLTKHQHDNNKLLDFFKNNSDKKIVKYALLNSAIFSYIPRNYPWVVQSTVKLSNYLGYEEHISEDNGYRRHIPFYGKYHWDWLQRTGADFVIYNAAAYKHYRMQIDKYIDKNTQLRLQNGDIVAKLLPDFAHYPSGYRKSVYDNGYIVLLHSSAVPQVSHFQASASKIEFDVQVNDNNTLLYLPFWANRHLRLSINGKSAHFLRKRDIYQIKFKRGYYHVKIYYHYPLLNIFLYMMAIYYLILFCLIVFWALKKLKVILG